MFSRYDVYTTVQSIYCYTGTSMSLEQYSQLTNKIEEKLDEADRIAASTEERYSHEEVFC